MAALDQAVRQGKAIYAGISMYTAEQTKQAAKFCTNSAHHASSTSPFTASSIVGSRMA